MSRAAGPAPTALILVRNTVSHDARVLREARTLSGLGLPVLIAGVVSATEADPVLELDGIGVIRLEPGRGLRRAAGTPRTSSAAPGPPLSSARRPAARLRRLALTASYYLEGTRLALETSPRLIHANDYNTMWIAVAAKLLRRSRVVYDCHELWPDRNGRPEWRPWLIACEALFVRIADATVTTSPGYAKAIAARYRVAPPILVRNIPAETAAPTVPGVGPPTAVYVGGLMPGRGLESAIAALAHAPEIRLRLIGPGRADYRDRLRGLAEQCGVADRLELREAVPPATVVGEIAGADVGLMLIEPVCRSYELTLPNKLFEYAAAGVPILSSDRAVIGEVVSAEGLGAVVPSDDPATIAAAVRRLADPETGASVRDRLHAFAARNTWERERAVLERIYSGLLDGEPERVAGVYARYRASPAKRRAWSADNPGNTAIRAELAEAVFELGGARLATANDVLDVGCGTGWWLARLGDDGRVGARLHGLELLPERAEAARRRAPVAEIVVGDARLLPYDDAGFDVVTLFTVLSSLASYPDVMRTLREARRVLRPAGVMFIWEPRLNNPLNRDSRFIPPSLIARVLAPMELAERTTTLVPPLARRLGSRTEAVYPLLGSVPALRTHRLVCARAR